MRVHPLRWKATRRFSSSRAAFARRLTGHERRPPEETCELVAGPARSSSIFVKALLMSCTLLSRRSCSVVESDCSKALTCGLWDTNALNLQRRRRLRMLFCGTKGPRTPSMRTGLFLIAGFLLLGAAVLLAKLFSTNYPGATLAATIAYVALWFIVAGVNMWV